METLAAERYSPKRSGQSPHLNLYCGNNLLTMKAPTLFLKTLGICFLLVLTTSNAQSSHLWGGSITYTCLGNNTYQVIHTGYKGCGSSAALSDNFTLTSVICGQQINSGIRTSLSTTGITPICQAALGNNTCLGGIQQIRAEFLTYIPPNCPDWTFQSSNSARISVSNLAAPSSGVGNISTLNTMGGLCNSSPIFNSPLVPFICDQEPFCFVPDAIDPDGDSLVFSLVLPLDFDFTPLSYSAPFSTSYPINTTSGSILFDSTNGNLCFTPSGIQNTVIAMQVEEFRNGVLVGSVLHDFTFLVMSCSNQFPILPGGALNAVVNGTALDSNSIVACAGIPLSFQAVFTDADPADSLSILSNITNTLPGASLQLTGTNPLTVNFSWVPGNNDLGFHPFYVEVLDNQCTIIGRRTYLFDINVLPATLAGPDLSYCPAGAALPIHVTGGGSGVTWSTLSGDPTGLSCTNCPNPLASPSTTSTYVVESNLVNACSNRDTITIEVVPDFLLNLTPDTTLCSNQYLQIQGLTGPASAGPFTSQWSPTTGLTTPNSPLTTVQVQDTSSFVFSATSAAGCTLVDSVTININGQAPILRLPRQDTICPGDSLQLLPILSYSCDTSSRPCSGPLDTISIGELSLLFNNTLSPGYLDSLIPNTVKVQYIFTAAELNTLGFTGGLINQLAINVLVPGDSVQDLSISVGCTHFSDWNTSVSSFLTGLLEVKFAFDFAPVSGWVYWNFDTPYSWDGVSNLVVEICSQTPRSGTLTDFEFSTTASPQQLALNFPFQANSCDQPIGISSTRRPNIRFEVCQDLTGGSNFSWTPPTYLSGSTLFSPIATPATDISYLLTVDDGSGCINTDTIALVIDTFVTAIATSLDSTPCLGQMVQLNGNANGSPSPNPFSFCGVNPDSCILPDQDYTFTDALSFADPSFGPFTSFGETDARYQYLYRASEMTTLGMVSGTINEIAWNVLQKFSTSPFENFCIKMGCTSDNSISQSGNWIPTTLVYGPFDYNTIPGWNTIPLDLPYEWDGNSNFVVEVCFDLPDGGSVGTDHLESSFNFGFNCFLSNLSSAPGASGCSLPYTGLVFPDRPAMRLTQCPRSGFSYSWSPGTGLSDPDIQNPILTYSGPSTYVLTVNGGRCPVTDTISFTDCLPLTGDQLQLFAEAGASTAQLHWALDHPEDLESAQLERSGDGSNYTVLHRETLGPGPAPENQYTDLIPAYGPNFYRVRTFNPNGEVALSNVVELHFKRSSGTIALYPNPATQDQSLTLDYYAQASGSLQLEWRDVWGRLVGRSSASLDAGGNHLSIETDGLAAGVYFLKIQSKQMAEVRKVVLRGG